MNLRTFLVEILVSTLAIQVSGLINEKIGSLPGGEVEVFRRGHIETKEKCISILTFKAKSISNNLRYDCVEDPSAAFGETFAIIDGVVYSEIKKPNVIVILKADQTCEYRDFMDRPVKSKPITDDEYCLKVKEAIQEQKTIDMIEREEELREGHGVFVVFDWLWDCIKSLLATLGLKIGSDNSEEALQKEIVHGYRPSLTDKILDLINYPLDYIGEHYWNEKPVDDSQIEIPDPSRGGRSRNPWD